MHFPLVVFNIWDNLRLEQAYTTNLLFSLSFLKTCTVIQAILFLPFINSCTPLNDVGYARTCVGESLNERSLSPFLPLSPPPSSVPSTSYYGISIKSLRLMGEPGLWEATLEKRDGRVCARRQHGTDLRWQSCGDEDCALRDRTEIFPQPRAAAIQGALNKVSQILIFYGYFLYYFIY